MTCKEIIKVLEANWPFGICTGLGQCRTARGQGREKVSRIYVTLDVTDDVLEQAQAWGLI